MSKSNKPKTLPRPILKKPSKLARTCDDAEDDDASYSKVKPNNEYRPKFSLLSDDEDGNGVRFAQIATTNKQHEEDALQLSKVAQNSKIIYPNSSSIHNKKSNLKTAIYVLHNRELSKEIVKLVMASTDGFFKCIKSELSDSQSAATTTTTTTAKSSDTELIKVHKHEFIPRLREFLTCSQTASAIKSINCLEQKCFNREVNNGVVNMMQAQHFILSEPEMPVTRIIDQIEREKDKQRFVTNIKTPSPKPLPPINITKNLYIGSKFETEPTSLVGSLPDQSFMIGRQSLYDSYEKEFAERDKILARNYRSNSIQKLQKRLLQTNALRYLNNIYDSSHILRNNRTEQLIEANTKQKKIVRFADSLGLDLANVKVISNNSFADIYTFDYSSTETDNSLSGEGLDGNMQSKPRFILVPCFTLPSSLADLSCFNKPKQDSFVKLDDYIFDYENKLIKCIIKVKNISFEKHVFARVTYDSWRTCNDIDAMYYVHPNKKIDSEHDYFSFCIFIPEKSIVFPTMGTNYTDDYKLKIEFAICYQCQNQIFWDNNNAQNYVFQCFYDLN